MKSQLTQLQLMLFAACCVSTLSACAWSDPVRVENDFGNSVRHMIAQQKQNPNATEISADTPPAGMDGGSVLNALGQYRAAQKRKVIKEKLDAVK